MQQQPEGSRQEGSAKGVYNEGGAEDGERMIIVNNIVIMDWPFVIVANHFTINVPKPRN